MAYISSYNWSTNSNTLLEQYVNAYIDTQVYKFEPYDLKAKQLENKQTFFTTLNGRLNNLLSAMDRFGTYKNVTDAETGVSGMKFVKVNEIDDKFVTRKVTTSSSDFLTASAKGTAMLGNNSVKVLQLATTDNYIGKQVSIAQAGKLDDALEAKLDENGNGKIEFSIKVGDTEKAFSVEYSATDSTEDVMKRITQTVNQRKIENEDGENIGGLGEVINAAFVKDTSGTARLTFASNATGEDNQITFSGADDIAVGLFGIKDSTSSTTRDVYDDTDAESYGYQAASAASLNARINLNGVTVIRGSNTISDAIDGITLNLRKVNSDSDPATVLSTDIDTKAVENLISPLMDAFNGLANYVAANKSLHGGDASMVGLQYMLRNMASEDLSGYADKDYVYSDSETKPIRYLAELGFRMSNDNVLTLSDPSKLENVLRSADGPKLIADIINGFTAKVSESVESLVARNDEQGLIKSRLSSISQQIESNNRKIQQIDDSIMQAADAVRKEYTAYLSAFYTAQNQLSLLAIMPNVSDSLVAQQTQINQMSSAASTSK